MRKKHCLRLMVALLLFSSLLGTSASADVVDREQPFPDVTSDAPYAEAVVELTQMGVITGDDRGYFNPSEMITRSEAAAVLCRLLNKEPRELGAAPFSDVPASHWACGYITAASELGIINGYGNGRFGPSDPVTYEQMVKMLLCAWGYEALAEQAGGWTQGYLSVAQDVGLGTDASEFPSQPAKRSTVAELCYQMLFVYENVE